MALLPLQETLNAKIFPVHRVKIGEDKGQASLRMFLCLCLHQLHRLPSRQGSCHRLELVVMSVVSHTGESADTGLVYVIIVDSRDIWPEIVHDWVPHRP